MTDQKDQTNEVVDPWAKALDKQDSQKKEREEAKNFTSYEFEEVVYEGFAIDKAVVFRITGAPLEYRNQPTDAKLVLQSRMVNDDAKFKIKVNWKFVEKKGKYVIDPDWILSRLAQKALAKQWVKFTEADIDGKEITKKEDGKISNKKGYDGSYKYLHVGTNTYNRLENNKTVNDTKSFGNAMPSNRVILNVISREDDWCKVNKHKKIIATKVGKSEKVDDKGEKTVKLYPETGISESMYADICGYIREMGINPNTTDLILTRTHNNDKYGQNIFDGDGLKKLGRGGEDVLAKIVEGPLTAEEEAYEGYDLDKLFAVSTYSKLKKNLSGLFKEFDSEFGENLYDELCLLVKEEEKQREAKKAEASKPDVAPAETKKEDEVPFDGATKITPSVEPVASEPVATPVEQPKPTEIADAGPLSSTPHWEKTSENDKAEMVKNVVAFTDIDNVSFKPESILLPCTSCNRNLPNTVMCCPYCGFDL